jgi:hypothetical protein
MMLVIVGLTFAAIGATTADWKVTLIPGTVAAAYIALGSLATAYLYDPTILTLCLVACVMSAMGVFTRRLVFGE